MLLNISSEFHQNPEKYFDKCFLIFQLRTLEITVNSDGRYFSGIVLKFDKDIDCP